MFNDSAEFGDVVEMAKQESTTFNEGHLPAITLRNAK